MDELQARLRQIEAEDARDARAIVQAQSRIDGRSGEKTSIREQILVFRRFQDGSLPIVYFERLKEGIRQWGGDAMKCQACGDHPDDARLSSCGHFYCAECFEKARRGICEHRGCGGRLRSSVTIDDPLYTILCSQFGVSPATYSNADSDDDISETVNTPRASRFNRMSTHNRNASSSLRHSSALRPTATADDEQSSEDDGFSDRSQRSRGYDDDGNSFVSEDESLDMEGSFKTDESTEDEEAMCIDTDEDEGL